MPARLSTIVMIISIIIIAWCAFSLYRNHWVYTKRIQTLMASRWNRTSFEHIEYHRLPSYNTMMFQFWKWDYYEVFDDTRYQDIGPDDELYRRDPFELIPRSK